MDGGRATFGWNSPTFLPDHSSTVPGSYTCGDVEKPASGQLPNAELRPTDAALVSPLARRSLL